MKNRYQITWLAAAVLLSFAVNVGLSAQTPSLEKILEGVEKAGNNLQSMRSAIDQKKWTDILEEYDDGESGQFYFLKAKSGVYLRKEITKPTQNTLVIQEGEVLFYQPSIKQAQQYQMGKHKDKAEFLLLGFGSDRETLHKTYNIELLGSEQLEGKETYKVQLTPKSESVAAFFVRIVLWIDPTIWMPIQQQLVEPTQDHLLIRFSKIELNAKMSKSDFKVKLPSDVKVVSN